MSAPQIPNLLAGRGRERGRGRGGLHADPAAADIGPSGTQAQHDKIVQQTDEDAAISRVSAVNAGLLQDEFAEVLAPSPPPGGTHRRFPIINRGTYARAAGIDRLVDAFLQAEPRARRQIISLGAGSDTRFFRLRSRREPPDVLYHELDFPANAQAKAATVWGHEALRALLGDEATRTGAEIHAPDYHLHAVDLRRLPADAGADAGAGAGAGLQRHVDPELPTLLLSECCLTYLAPAAADAVIDYFVAHLLRPSAPVGLVLYEPIRPADAFGRVMVANLAARGIVLQTLQRYGTLGAQRARLAAHGLAGGQRAVDVDFLFEHWVDEAEKARVAQAEMLDEIEELRLLLRHYCIAWGWRDGGGKEGRAAPWERWKLLEGQEEDEM